MPIYPYPPPVDALLSYGAYRNHYATDWPNYVQELNLSREHVPDLVRMTQDEILWQSALDAAEWEEVFHETDIDPKLAFWAPFHAWRALGQLQAVEAIPALIEVLKQRDIDWCWEELPEVFGLMGAGAIEPLQEVFATKLHYDHKITLAGSFGKIAKAFPDLRDRCAAVLTELLSDYPNHHRSVNGALVTELFFLRASEALPVIEAAYKANKVDEMFVGSWARLQVDWGLKQESDFTAEELAIHYTPQQKQMLANIRADIDKKMGGDLPGRGAAFGSGKPPVFKDIAPQTSAKKRSNKAGFGGGVASNARKRKKKKK
jgi:hypothetical protein